MGPYKDEILVNGIVMEGEDFYNYILQDGDEVEGRTTEAGKAERAAKVQQEEDRLKNRSLKEKILDGIESFIEAIFNPFGY